MRNIPALATLSIGMLLGMASHARAGSYEYHFVGNPDAHSTSPDTTLDVQFTFGFTDEALNAHRIGDVTAWQAREIWLDASYQGKTVSLGEGLSSGGFMLRYANDTGVIETFFGNFLDVDLHSGNSLVIQHDLPFDPFVGGQLNAYRDQADYIAASAVWLQRDRSSLAAHSVVPEPSTWMSMVAGLAMLGGGVLRKKMVGKAG